MTNETNTNIKLDVSGFVKEISDLKTEIQMLEHANETLSKEVEFYKSSVAVHEESYNKVKLVNESLTKRVEELLKQNDALAMRVNAIQPSDSKVEELKYIIVDLEKKCEKLYEDNEHLRVDNLKLETASKKLEHECIELHKENKKLKYELAEKDTTCENTCDCATGSLHYEAECERLMHLNEELQEDIKDISIERKRLRSMLNVVEMIFGGELV